MGVYTRPPGGSKKKMLERSKELLAALHPVCHQVKWPCSGTHFGYKNFDCRCNGGDFEAELMYPHHPKILFIAVASGKVELNGSETPMEEAMKRIEARNIFLSQVVCEIVHHCDLDAIITDCGSFGLLKQITENSRLFKQHPKLHKGYTSCYYWMRGDELRFKDEPNLSLHKIKHRA